MQIEIHKLFCFQSLCTSIFYGLTKLSHWYNFPLVANTLVSRRSHTNEHFA